MTRKTGQRNNKPKKAKIKSNIRINLKPFLKNYTNSELRPTSLFKITTLSLIHHTAPQKRPSDTTHNINTITQITQDQTSPFRHSVT